MGNLAALLRDHTLGDQIASGGPGNIWKIFDAKRRPNNEPVSLFVFDKAILERQPKPTAKAVSDMLLNEVQILTKLRHPRVLAILRPAQDTKKAIIFETEPVFASLANILRDYSNIKPSHALESFQLEPLEIKIGILQIAEGLDFLHHNANLIHRNICPSSIYLTRKGEWKICGFNFSTFSSYKPGVGDGTPLKEFNAREGFQTQPDMDYLAPENIFTKRYDYSSDLFSLGCTLYQMYAGSKLFTNLGNVLTYKHNIEQLHRSLDLHKVPPELHRTLQELLSLDPTKRLDTRGFMTSDYFNDIHLRSMAFLSNLMEKENPAKAAFFKGFYNILETFTPRIIESKVLPPLLQELKNEIQLPFVVPIVMELSKKLTPRKFQTIVFPFMSPLFNIDLVLRNPTLGPLLVQNLDFFITKLPDNIVEQSVLPFLYHLLDCNSSKLQDLAIRKIPEIANSIDYVTFKSNVLTRIQAIVSRSDSINSGVRLNGLICLSKVISILDKAAIMDIILPTLEVLCTTDHSPKIVVAVFHCYSSITGKVGPQVIAQRFIPFLTPLCCQMDLEIEQFTTLITLIKSLVKVVEDWRLAEFQAKKDVEQHLEASPQDEFASQKQFEHLVASQFEEQHRRKVPPASKTVISQPPPSTSDEKSFQQLIKSEERLRENSQQNDQELLSMLGGKAVAHIKQTGIAGNLKSLQISSEASETDPWSQIPSQPPTQTHFSSTSSQQSSNTPSVIKEPDFSLLSPISQNQSTSPSNVLFSSGTNSNPNQSSELMGNYNPTPVRTPNVSNQPPTRVESQFPQNRSNFANPSSNSNSGSGIINSVPNPTPANSGMNSASFMNPSSSVTTNFSNLSTNFSPSTNTGSSAFINPSSSPSLNLTQPTNSSSPINSSNSNFTNPSPTPNTGTPASHGQSSGFTGFNLEAFSSANFPGSGSSSIPQSNTQVTPGGFSSTQAWDSGFGAFQAADVPSTNSNINFGSFTSAQAVPAGFPTPGVATPATNNFGAATLNLESFQQAPSNFQGANPQGGFDFAMFPNPPKPKTQNDNVWGTTNFSADAFFS